MLKATIPVGIRAIEWRLPGLRLNSKEESRKKYCNIDMLN